MQTARLIAAALFVCLTACAPWTPEPSDFPVKVDVGADLTEPQRQALYDGIDKLEERVGANVFAPVESNGRKIQRGRIAVRSGPLGEENGFFDPTHWSCRITLGSDDAMYPEVAVHELLHCLGLDHDADPDSVMYESTDTNSRIMLSHVNHVRSLMDLPELPALERP